MSRRVLAIYAVVVVAGFVAGLADYLATRGRHQALVHHPADNAIAVHVALAACLAFLIVGYVVSQRRAAPVHDDETLPQGYAGFWKWPFTEHGWRRTLFSLVAAPVCCAEFLLTVVGQVRIARRIEVWRLRRFLHTDVPRRPESGHRRAAVAYHLVGLPIGIVLSSATLVAFYFAFRVGLQVSSFAPAGNINAWGGPTYLGALLAHWLDSFFAFYACVMILRGFTWLQVGWARQQLDRSIGADTTWSNVGLR